MFLEGRDLSASLGVVPKQHTTGGSQSCSASANAATSIYGCCSSIALGRRCRRSQKAPARSGHEDIKITVSAPMVRTVECEPGPASWCNGAGAGPVRTAGRSTISAQRAVNSPLAAASSPPTAFTSSWTPADKKKRRKDKWLFTKTGEPWFCIAGIWRSVKDVGEAFTLLTMPPGSDIAPCSVEPASFARNFAQERVDQ